MWLSVAPTSAHVQVQTNGKLTMLLNDLQELDDDLRGRSNDDLSLTGLLGVVDSVQGISQNRCSSHFSMLFGFAKVG